MTDGQSETHSGDVVNDVVPLKIGPVGATGGVFSEAADKATNCSRCRRRSFFVSDLIDQLDLPSITSVYEEENRATGNTFVSITG